MCIKSMEPQLFAKTKNLNFLNFDLLMEYLKKKSNIKMILFI